MLTIKTNHHRLLPVIICGVSYVRVCVRGGGGAEVRVGFSLSHFWHVEVREHLCGVGSLLSRVCEFCKWNLMLPGLCAQVPLPAEPSHHVLVFLVVVFVFW